MKEKKLGGGLLALTLALCVALLTACGGAAGPAAPDKGNAGGGAAETGAKTPTVSNMAELLDAIKPGAEIVLAPGRYNLTEYVNDFWLTDEAQAFNAEHDCVQIRDCYDGAEIVIRSADGVSISGGGNTEDTEIVIEPRYGTVLTFQGCDNIKLSNLTLGHTDTGECSGSVVDLSACRNAELRNMDLYGCGVIALECSNGTEGVYVYDSALRDCSQGPLDVYDAVGKVELRNCALTGSDGGGWYNELSRAELAFYNCVFGEAESYYWRHMPGITAEDCVWDEPEYEDTEDMGDGEMDYEPPTKPDNLAEATFDAAEYGSSMWIGYQLVNPDTGETVDLPSGGDASDVYMTMSEYGMGALVNYAEQGAALPFIWEQDGASQLSLWTRHDGTLYVTSYSDPDADGSPIWLALRTPEGILWMY